MIMKRILFLSIYLLFLQSSWLHAQQSDALPRYNIGLLIMATGKYVQFIEPLITSARTYFCTNHNVTYFVFTDGQIPEQNDVVTMYQERLGWPYDTMMRCIVYNGHRDELEKMDYLFALDADMRFVDTVGYEILSNLVATQHPGYVGRRGTYETRQQSTAYIPPHEGSCYFAGGFYGGTSTEFLRMAQTMQENIYTDLKNGIVAIWHDESHLNRYFINHQPTLILSPSYCYPENWRLPYHKRLLALDKNHAALRNEAA